MLRRARAALPMAAIGLLAAALRLYGLGFGLPHPEARPDETIALGHADAVVHGNLNPHFFHWPSFAIYIFAAALGGARMIGIPLTRTREFLIGRFVVAIAGTLAVPVVAAIARRMADRATSLVAATFLAVATLHVRESHFAMTDVIMTLLLLISLALLMRASDGDRLRYYGGAGLAGGLAASTKYSAAVILLLAAAVPASAAAITYAAAWSLGFLSGTPFALIDFREFAEDVNYERAHLSGGHAVALGRGWLYHVQTTLPSGTSLVLCIAAAAGMVLAIRRYGRRALVPVLFTALFYVSIGAGRTVFFRYALPLVPMVCLFAAVAIRQLGGQTARALGIRDAIPVTAIAAACAGPSLRQSVQLDRLLARDDSRVVAERWLATRLHPDDSLHDSGGNYSRLWWEPGTEFHEWHYDANRATFGDPQGRTPRWILLYQSPLPEYTAAPASLRALVEQRYEFVHRIDGVPAAPGNGVYDRQDAFFLPIAGFSGVARPGPTVLIYRLRDR